MKCYLKIRNHVKLIWLKIKEPREVRKERFFMSFQRTLYELIKMEKGQGNLEHHGLDMAVQYARFIFVREGLVGKSILGFLSV